MKRLEKLLYHACTFSVLISVMVLTINAFSGFKNPSISFTGYLVILLFSLAIAISNMIFEIKSLKPYVKFPIHFAVLFFAFYMTFANGSTFNVNSAADFMEMFIAFAFFYILIACVAFLIIKSVKKLDKALPQKKANVPEKKQYSPRFK